MFHKAIKETHATHRFKGMRMCAQASRKYIGSLASCICFAVAGPSGTS